MHHRCFPGTGWVWACASEGRPEGVASKQSAEPLARVDLSQSRLALLFNPGSGKKDARDRVDEIRARLEGIAREFALYPVTDGSQIAASARRAVAEGADIVAVFGGDGTQNAVAGALRGTDAVMAVLPGGTFNYFARELGVGQGIDAAIDAILAGHVARRNLGELNGRVFLNNASLGVYPQILETRESIYRRWGRSRLAAYWSVIVALNDLRAPMHLHVNTADGTRDYVTPLVFVAHSAYQLESLGLEGAEMIEQGHFAVFVLRHLKRRDLMLAALRLAMGRASHGDDFDLLVTDELTIEAGRKSRLVALDGEKTRMNAPFELKVLHDALRVIVAPDLDRPDRGQPAR